MLKKWESFQRLSLLVLALLFMWGCHEGDAGSNLGSLLGSADIMPSVTDPNNDGEDGNHTGVVPEPASLALLGSGLASMIYYRTRKKKGKKA